MATDAQRRAVDKLRQRRRELGIARFEVAAPARDKDLVRSVARRLAEAGPKADALRTALRNVVAGEQPAPTGGIWHALRRSPMVGAELDFPREQDPGRDLDL